MRGRNDTASCQLNSSSIDRKSFLPGVIRFWIDPAVVCLGGARSAVEHVFRPTRKESAARPCSVNFRRRLKVAWLRRCQSAIRKLVTANPPAIDFPLCNWHCSLTAIIRLGCRSHTVVRDDQPVKSKPCFRYAQTGLPSGPHPRYARQKTEPQLRPCHAARHRYAQTLRRSPPVRTC